MSFKKELLKKSALSLCLGAMVAFSLVGCGDTTKETTGEVAEETATEEQKWNVVATTTMLSDLTRIIGGEHVEVIGLMGPGVDPHLYQATANDTDQMATADMVVYNGLHLEGQMVEFLEESLPERGVFVTCIENGLDESELLGWTGGSTYDPHFWFDVTMWMDAAKETAKGFSEFDPDNKADYEANLDAYMEELEELDAYVKEKVEGISKEDRVLVTSHDAFQYFSVAYGFQVEAVQGISTEAEASTDAVSSLAGDIYDNGWKAIFTESSVSPKTIEAVQEAVEAKGGHVEIGGELYSDSYGDEASGDDSYIKMCTKNIDIIYNALTK